MAKGLKIGDDAPLFKLESYNAGVIDLGELIGSQKIVIIFSRYFGCPICQLDLKEILINVNAIEKNELNCYT
jgi:peroxiredoxin